MYNVKKWMLTFTFQPAVSAKDIEDLKFGVEQVMMIYLFKTFIN